MTEHRDAMLDLETLGTNTRALIVSIGAVCFDRAGGLGAEFYARIYLDTTMGEVDGRTVEWWMKRADRWPSEEGAEYLAKALERFTLFWNANRLTTPWSKGAGFDTQIMAAAYRRCRMTAPWLYRSPRDLRTLLDVAGMLDDEGLVRGWPAGSHNALEDAKLQTRQAHEAFARLRGPADRSEASAT